MYFMRHKEGSSIPNYILQQTSIEQKVEPRDLSDEDYALTTLAHTLIKKEPSEPPLSLRPPPLPPPATTTTLFSGMESTQFIIYDVYVVLCQSTQQFLTLYDDKSSSTVNDTFCSVCNSSSVCSSVLFSGPSPMTVRLPFTSSSSTTTSPSSASFSERNQSVVHKAVATNSSYSIGNNVEGQQQNNLSSSVSHHGGQPISCPGSSTKPTVILGETGGVKTMFWTDGANSDHQTAVDGLLSLGGGLPIKREPLNLKREPPTPPPPFQAFISHEYGETLGWGSISTP
ncbi:unnamed protein product [Lepeophtheirus salmonis]|uniref:(salmon louse) hypothetical protein n=1 Tax=Lepeophtheirus salmonis TaxID=72036 RepID=A0A7R8CFT6_LEPSM|nr:unnamed protein product [Lepeophtheirus salmonis]CAF2809442.1 unnamed protein product [Lepeophtheirus salmonis]